MREFMVLIALTPCAASIVTKHAPHHGGKSFRKGPSGGVCSGHRRDAKPDLSLADRQRLPGTKTRERTEALTFEMGGCVGVVTEGRVRWSLWVCRIVGILVWR